MPWSLGFPSPAVVILAMGVLPMAIQPALADQSATVRAIADTHAGSTLTDGKAVGIGVGIVIGDRTYFFSYGNAIAATDTSRAVRFTPATVFQIGSNTKVFTTNLLDQAVHDHILRLDDALTSLSAETGLLPGMRQVTLKQFGDFTSGLPNYAPICVAPATPQGSGCRPNGRPSIQQYDAGDFLTYFRNFTAPSLPAGYDYSDFSTGLLGLLLGGTSALDNHAVDAWFSSVEQRILDPLGMHSTFLYVPAGARGRVAGGYDLALAEATVSGGELSDYTMVSTGALYTMAPTVRVIGGPGGATATAELDGQHVKSLNPGAKGSGYQPPNVTFDPPSALSGQQPIGRVVVRNGRIIGVKMLKFGSLYTAPPKVTFSSPEHGRPAIGIAHVALGSVTFVTIKDPGSGYQTPISVQIGAPNPASNTIPVWAPAGALSSTIRDMTAFAQAALLHRSIGGRPVDPAITDGFRIAETPYACQAKDPDLRRCGPDQTRSALAWGVTPADDKNNVPQIVVKDGGVGGFSSEIRLMPERDMAVVVFANAREIVDTSSADGTPTRTAENIADNILYALFYLRADEAPQRAGLTAARTFASEPAPAHP